ncbi:MAG: DNA-directed RNA polymerase sigma-70 factor [Gemmatales bacterium]|nr:MAG: DNA-directed RNA polymerase sigma-70 factor [Gemmatales bacterium]
MQADTEMSKRISQSEIGRLLMQHRTGLYAFILACVRNHADAEDVLQSVSMAAIAAHDQLQDEAGFLPWAREIARRRILEWQRKKLRLRPLDPDTLQRLIEAADHVERQRSSSDEQSALMECLDQLPDQSRRLIARRYDPHSGGIAEIAQQQNQTVQAVYARIKRIKAILRDCVQRRLAMETRS